MIEQYYLLPNIPDPMHYCIVIILFMYSASWARLHLLQNRKSLSLPAELNHNNIDINGIEIVFEHRNIRKSKA